MHGYRVDVASVKEGPFSRVQLLVIALCILLGSVDGFDNLAIAYAAPVMRGALNLNSSVLGWVFSISVIGGIVGLLFGGPLADKFGRRPTLISQTFLFGIFTLLSAFAHSSSELLFYRFFAGIGLGVALTVSYAVVAEFSPSRNRIFCITLIYAGYSTGAGLGGLLAGWLLKTYSWQAIFYVGAAAALVLALVFVAMLPETLDFMVGANRASDSIEKLARRIRPQLFEAGTPVFFAVREVEQSGFRGKELFSPKWIGKTLLLWLVLFMNLVELYSIQQWLPTLMHESGLDIGSSVSAGAVLQTGAIFSAFACSQIIDRWNEPFKLFPWLFFGGGIAFVSLAYSGSATVWVMASVLFLGVFVFGSQIALNGVTTIIYPPAIRATGLSWAIAVGRIGGASGPIVTGLLLQSGFSAAQVILFGALPASLAVIAAFCLVMNGAELHDEMQEVPG